MGRTTKDVIDEIAGAGDFITDLGRWPETRAIEEYVLQACRGLLGKEHPATISAMSNLASTLGNQGQLDKAARMQKQVLEKRKRILGEEHPDTISAMNNLAITLRQQSLQDQEQSQATTDAQTQVALVQPLSVSNSLLQGSSRKRTKF
jgi:hypothetical protein